MVHAYPSFSPCLFFLSCSLQSLHSPFVLLYLSSSSHFVPFCLRTAFLFLLLGTSLFSLSLILSALHPSFSVSFSLFLVSEDLLTRGPRVSRRALWWLLRWLLRWSLESSRESVPPEGQGTPSGTGSPPSLPLFTPPLSTSPPLPLSFSFSLSSLHRVPLASRPMPPPVRTLGFYLFSLITAVGM